MPSLSHYKSIVYLELEEEGGTERKGGEGHPVHTGTGTQSCGSG